MKLKYYRMLYPIAILIGLFVFFYFWGKNNDDKFYQNKIDSKVIKRNNWQLRTTEFYLRNDLRIDSNVFHKVDLKIGDSISKPANTKAFDVYRKNKDGEYKLFKHYDNE